MLIIWGSKRAWDLKGLCVHRSLLCTPCSLLEALACLVTVLSAPHSTAATSMCGFAFSLYVDSGHWNSSLHACAQALLPTDLLSSRLLLNLLIHAFECLCESMCTHACEDRRALGPPELELQEGWEPLSGGYFKPNLSSL